MSMSLTGNLLTPSVLAAIMPHCADPEGWAPELGAACERFGVHTRKPLAAFLAQVAHESRELTWLEESLNYTPERLLATFPLRINATQAAKLGRSPEHPADQAGIAELVYGGRRDLGNTKPGDGAAFIGRGAFQTTGRANYTALSAFFGIALPDVAKWLKSKPGASLSAAYYWRQRGLSDIAEVGNFDEISRRINGAKDIARVNGLEERRRYHARAQAMLRV